MIIVTVLIGLCATILLLPTTSDLLSIARLGLGRKRTASKTDRSPRLLALIPAHNEELLVEACVQSVLGQRYPAEQLSVVVIADNCTDATAEIARRAGARCLERCDPSNPGKPMAIAWALEQADYTAYDAVLIIDADTVVDSHFARHIAEVAELRSGAVQGYHGVRNRTDNSLTRMAAVFAAARYEFEFPLKAAAGLNLPLMGNGMCIGTEVIAERGWTAFSICEDWELYAQLTERGVHIRGTPLARLYSQEARSLAQSASQRRRWAAGKLTVAARLALPLVRSSKISIAQKLDVLAELLAPGPAVLLALVVSLVAAAHLTGAPGVLWLDAALLVPVIRLGLYALAAVQADPQPVRALFAFFYLPFYSVWRLFVQLSALGMLGDKPWVRTERHFEASAESRSS